MIRRSNKRKEGVTIHRWKFGLQHWAILKAASVASLIAIAACSTSFRIEPNAEAAASLDPILIGAGDIAWCESRNDEATATLVEAAFSPQAPVVVFTIGDNVYESGSHSQFKDCYEPTWGRFKENTRPSVGNHEYLTPGAAGYFEYFGDAAGSPGEGYYSFDLGDWHIVVLNSNCSEVGGCSSGSAQEEWLRRDLAAHPSFCTAAYFHHPLFTSRDRGGLSSIKPLWQALYDFGAEIVLNGHDHFYERFAPQDPSGRPDPVRGIREFVVGTGGKNLADEIQIAPNSELININTFGVLKLTLSSNSYHWEFIPVPSIFNTFADSGSNSCH